jgi:hypothetical protein
MVDTVHIWASIAEIAGRDGVTKQAVSKTIRQYAGSGELPVQRDLRDRVSKVSLAHYDHLRRKYVNPAKAAAPLFAEHELAAPSEASGKDPTSFEEARRRGEWLKVTAQELRLAEEQGALVRKDILVEALTKAGREIQKVVERLQNTADDLATAVAKEGAHGARVELRKIALKLNGEIADKLAAIMAKAPETDALLEEAA